MKKRYGTTMRKIFAGMLALLMVMGAVMMKVPVTAQNRDTTRVLRVGYVDYEGFIFENEDGEMVGYAVEYLETIGKKANIKFEFVQCAWEESLEKIKNHELDLVCTAFYSDERAVEFAFSNQNFGRVRCVLYTTEDNEDVYYEDFEKLDGQKIGFIKGSLNISICQEYAKKHDFSFEPVLYDSEEAMNEALYNGEIIAIGTEQMSIHEDLKLIGVYGSRLYYLMSYQGNDFMADIDEAMMTIYTDSYEYEAYLYNKYYGEANRKHALCFTREEMEYIQENPHITVGILPGLYPLAYADEETGEPVGIYASILDCLAEISGLNLEKVLMGPDENPIDTVGIEKKYDLTMTAVDDKTIQNESIILTNNFMESSIGMVGRPDSVYRLEDSFKIAVNDRFVSLHDFIKEKMPQCELLLYETDEECLQAVLDGEADIMMQNVYVINYLLQKPRFEILQLIPTSTVLSGNAFVVSVDADPRLVSILNKAIDYFSKEDFNRIVIQHTTAVPYDYSLEDVWDKYQTQIIVIFSLLIVCISLFVVLFWLKQRHNTLLQTKNYQLREAVDQALKANESKSDFFARVSHELRTPINAIVGISEIAKKSVDNGEKMKESLEKIETSSKLLLSIVNDILDISAIENAKMKITSEPFEIQKILDGVRNIYEMQCKNKGIDFVIVSELEDARFKGDELRIKQILLNLVSNAYKFTSAGGEIKLEAYRLGTAYETTNVRFVVSDTGAGMSQDMLGRLFVPFEQESPSTAKTHGGSGLGMPITKNLVDMMGGQISVESTLGQGTIFMVDLPFEELDMDEIPGAVDLDEISLDDIDFTGMRILLAEDNELNAEIAVDLLNMLNLEVDVVKDGEEAVERFLASEPGYYRTILMDIQMPKMNGYEASKVIRKSEHPHAKKIPIVAMTANSSREDITAAMSAGMSGHIPKPIDTEDLYRTLWVAVNDLE